MSVLKDSIHVLIIEDNPGDVVLIEEYFSDEFKHHQLFKAETFGEAEKVLKKNEIELDAILLDLTLPDCSGEELVNKVLTLAGQVPVIILTGYSDRAFSVDSLALGVCDYLFKSDLSAFQLRKSIEYSIERTRITQQLQLSEKKYRELFHFSPSPMWVYDIYSRAFLDVNEAAELQYGYTREEFLSMNIRDIRPEDDIPLLEEMIDNQEFESLPHFKGVFNHLKKSGERIAVEVQSNMISFDGKKAKLVLASDITEKLQIERELIYSEQRFKALVQNGADVIAILDRNSIFQYVSPTSKPILGISQVNLVGQNLFEFVHPEDVNDVKESVKELKNENRIEVHPFRFSDNKKTWRWLTVVLTDMTRDPAVGGVVANARDVTESILAERKLKRSNERYDIVSKATSDVIWDWDMKSDTITWSASIRKMFGYGVRDVKDSGDWRNERIHPDDYLNIQHQFRKMLKGRKVNWQEEYRFRCADGSYKYVFDRGFIVYNDRNKAVRVIGAMQDITNQKQKAEEREQLLRELTSHNNDLRQFSYITSHNLRAPLSNIVGLLYLIDDIDIENEPLKELLDGVQVSATQLKETIDDLGQIITIKNSPSTQRETIRFEEVMKSVLGQISQSVEEIEANIDYDFSPASTVHFNKSYLESILLNLATNAIKYRSPKRPLKIRIQTVKRGQNILLNFEDNGLGIDTRRYKDRLFGLYQRFHPEKDGKGIGLFLVKSQMEAMDGTITIQSKVDAGTRFTLTFKEPSNDR